MSAERGRAPAWAPPLLLGAMVGALVAGRLETALLAIAVAAVAAVAAHVRWPGRRWLVALASGTALAIVLNLYLTPGRAIPALSVFGWPASVEGLRFGALLALRWIGAALAWLGLAAAWPGERAADELARLLRPLARLKVPVAEGRAVVALSLRFVPMIGEEARRIAALQALRAGRTARGWRERIEQMRASLVPTLIAAIERADRTALALEARHHRLRALPAAQGRAHAAVIAGWALFSIALLWRA